jgi:hypothetical protein
MGLVRLRTLPAEAQELRFAVTRLCLQIGLAVWRTFGEPGRRLLTVF